MLERREGRYARRLPISRIRRCVWPWTESERPDGCREAHATRPEGCERLERGALGFYVCTCVHGKMVMTSTMTSAKHLSIWRARFRTRVSTSPAVGNGSLLQGSRRGWHGLRRQRHQSAVRTEVWALALAIGNFEKRARNACCESGGQCVRLRVGSSMVRLSIDESSPGHGHAGTPHEGTCRWAEGGWETGRGVTE